MPINERALRRWADILIDRILGGVGAKDVVMVKGEAVAWPLISKLQEKILRDGGLPDIQLIPPDNERGRLWGTTVAKLAALSRLRGVPKWQRLRNQGLTKYIEILGMEHPELASGASGPVLQKIMCLDRDAKRVLTRKPWVVTMYPTQAFAKMEGLSLAKYEKLVLAASIQDPKMLAGRAERLTKLLKKTRLLRILTSDGGKAYELRVDIAGRRILSDTPKSHNIPCGEVYTSPDSSSVEGEIFLDLPILRMGRILQGVFLRFDAGKVVAFRARKGKKVLSDILGTDTGARRIGEIAFGINSGLKRPLSHALFCEKVAGTMHLALGNCFPTAFVAAPESKYGRARLQSLAKAGITNLSAQHVDLVVSFRQGGAGHAVFLDGKPLRLRNGNWDPE